MLVLYPSCRPAPEVVVENNPLRLELLRMHDDDRQFLEKFGITTDRTDPRMVYPDFVPDNSRRIVGNAVDEYHQEQLKHTGRLKEIVRKNGWPGIRLVGSDGSESAWIGVLASNDAEFQKKCLSLIETAVRKVQAPKRYYAYLLDRILVREGKKQLFGTQFRIQNGKSVPYPIEDNGNVNLRRKEAGMESLESMILQLNNGN